MLNYLVKRIVLFIPSLMVLVLLCFLLLELAPGSPLDHLSTLDEQSAPILDKKNKYRWEIEKGIHLPVCYISLKSCGKDFPESWIPSFQWNTDNKFHRWFWGSSDQKGIVLGNFGRSYITNQNVNEIIYPAFGRSLTLVILSLLLSYAVSIPIGIRLAMKPKDVLTGKISILFNVLFSLPVFWVAMLLIMCFANPYIFDLLPPSGVRPSDLNHTEGFFSGIMHSIPYLILPVICYSYSSVALVSFTLTNVMKEELNANYIRTARAKGLNEKVIVYKHAFRNAVLPLLTLLSQAFPAVMGGSVIIESIFSIPGMGTVIYNAIGSKDYPILLGTFFLTGLVTMTGFLITDILYSMADPRVKYSAQEIK